MKGCDMSSVSKPAAKRKTAQKRRKHHPELLRCKRAARALGIAWSDVTAERDRLRREELEEREQADSLHKAATAYFGGNGAAPFWRGFFRRKFAKLIASGGDYTSVKGFDEFVQQFEGVTDHTGAYVNAGAEVWSCDGAWELLIEERPPLKSIWEHYERAIVELSTLKFLDGQIVQAVVSSSSTPF
jgi:hypothetical protein